ncbi:MAG: hypothetical protein M3R02_27630 [Chloroflexota bacterium]|nr:hypothetical protein [Chloroflexota bacterium]MDP9459459.1 hypothetical protein [Actinomycetota bacterium]
MPVDAYDPGPLNNYPYWPRDAAGKPLNTPADAEAAGSGTYMPHGKELSDDHDRDGYRKVHDLTPRKPDGTPIEPPTIPPPTGA